MTNYFNYSDYKKFKIILCFTRILIMSENK